MSDPSVILQQAILGALTATGAAGSLVSGRIYDAVPRNTEPGKPYITFGAFQVIDDGAGCIDGAEVYVTIDVWSVTVGSIEAKTIAAAVAADLNGADLDLSPDHHLVEILHQNTRVLADPDGITTHAVLTFRALTEAA